MAANFEPWLDSVSLANISNFLRYCNFINTTQPWHCSTTKYGSLEQQHFSVTFSHLHDGDNGFGHIVAELSCPIDVGQAGCRIIGMMGCGVGI